MFEQLGDRLDGVFRRLKGRGVITPPMLREGLREVRRALLEADVNFHVARDFLKRVEQRALGEKVLESVRPAEQIVKIVHDELIEVLGGASAESGLAKAAVPPSVIMLDRALLRTLLLTFCLGSSGAWSSQGLYGSGPV